MCKASKYVKAMKSVRSKCVSSHFRNDLKKAKTSWPPYFEVSNIIGTSKASSLTDASWEKTLAHAITTYKPCGTQLEEEQLAELLQPFYPGKSYKFPRRMTSGFMKLCNVKLFDKHHFMTHNESNDSATCVMCEKGHGGWRIQDKVWLWRQILHQPWISGMEKALWKDR